MTSKLKIAYMLPHLGKGGAEELIIKLASDMSESQHVKVFLFYKLVESKASLKRLPKNVTVEYFFNREVSFLGVRRKILQALFYIFFPILFLVFYFKFYIRQFDVVHINLTLPSLYMCGFKVLSKLFRTNEKYVQTFHTNSHLLKGFSKFINKFSWKFSDVFVYEIYKEDIEYFSKFIQASKIKYIPFGYCSQGPQAKNALLNEPKYGKLLERIKNRKVFMTVSRIRFFEKKIDVMIEAMRLYKQHNDDFVFVIAGDGEDMDIAESMVMSYGLSDNVVFLGYVDNPELLAQYADVYIVAVVGKSTGVSGMQAISNQVPVIGVQTVSGFKSSSDNNIKESTSAQGLCELLIELDAEENYSEYKGVTKDIADLNCENQKRFTTSYLSLYKEVSNLEADA